MKRYILIILQLLILLYVEAQNPTMPTRNYQLIPQTPILSQFQRYDEQPVSEYTGIPNISVPVYNIQMEEVSIPIDLRYHAGGIKVNQDASWVGLGWDLSFYSVIQTINDLDDLSTTETKMLPDWLPTPSSSIYQYPYYPIKHEDLGVSGYVYNNFPQVDLPQPNSSAVDMKHHYWIAPRWYFSVNGIRKSWENLFSDQIQFEVDSEPDIFKITLPGVCLNITLDFKSGSFIVLNKKGYKVSKTDDTWKIINPDGVEFYFTDKTEIKTNCWVSNAGATPIKINEITGRTWMINKIITPKGREVKFSYIKTSNAYKNTIKTQSKDESLNFRTSEVPCLSRGHSSIDITTVYSLATTTTESEEIQLYPSSIVFPEGSINFLTSDRQDLTFVNKLDEIKVITLDNTIIKSVKFNYDYFKEKNFSSKRLKLLSVIENNEAIYSFTYNATLLPPKNSYEQDYWGYPNGCTTNTSLIPNPSRFKLEYNNKNNGNNLSANLAYTKSAILEVIKYPTGGSVSFDYELNEFNNYWVPDKDSLDNKISKGYGLRVKDIIYKDGSGEIKKTTYKYSDGIAILKNSMIEKFSRQFVRRTSGNYEKIQQDDVLSLNINGFYNSNPLSSFNSVGYGKVTKYNIDRTKNNGKVITFYHNNEDITPKQPSSGINMVTFISTPAFKNSNVPENGSPRLIQNYNNNNILLQETSYEYNNIISTLYYGARVSPYANHVMTDLGDNSDPCPLTLIPLHTVGLYPIFDFESLMTKKVDKVFTQSDSIVTTETYIYRTNNLLFRITRYNSIDSSDNKYYYYPQDYSSTDIYKIMMDRNILTPVIKEQSVNYQGKIKKERLTDYINDISITKGLILPSSEKDRFDKATEMRTDVTYDLYDEKGNIQQLTTLDSISTVYLWSYNYQYPIAEIKDATYTQVRDALGGQTAVDNIAKSITLSDADKTKIDNLRTNTGLPNAMVTTYTYRPLVGMLSATDPSGITTYYDYDSFGRLKETYIIENNIKKIVQSYNYHYQNQ